jgi:hypothetical protein
VGNSEHLSSWRELKHLLLRRELQQLSPLEERLSSLQRICHLDRSVAKWRDLQFFSGFSARLRPERAGCTDDSLLFI